MFLYFYSNDAVNCFTLVQGGGAERERKSEKVHERNSAFHLRRFFTSVACSGDRDTYSAVMAQWEYVHMTSTDYFLWLGRKKRSLNL